jgi:hypothetical protein
MSVTGTDKRRLVLELQQELVKTPPGSGRYELHRQLRKTAHEVDKGQLEAGRDLQLDDHDK